MKNRVTVIIEKANDGGYSCYMADDVGNFGLQGYGDTAAEAKADFLEAYEELKEVGAEDGFDVPQMSFVWKYDMQSFFNYFSFLNVSKIAERAGINSSQMRQYASGASKATQMQYDRLSRAVASIRHDLEVATF